MPTRVLPALMLSLVAIIVIASLVVVWANLPDFTPAVVPIASY